MALGSFVRGVGRGRYGVDRGPYGVGCGLVMGLMGILSGGVD